MSDTTRRTFIQSTLASAAAMRLANRSVLGANEKLVVGVIGCGGQGRAHIHALREAPGIEIAYVCEPDDGRAKDAAKEAGDGAKRVTDLRRVLDDNHVDAVTIATPDHWHAPAGILAMDAGKHLYVEKPCAHNLREGRLLVDAARRNKRVCQHGTQSRSAEFIQNAVKLLHEGVIGRVLVAKVWNVQFRGNIGHGKPGDPPAGVDYDMWLGPAPHVPFQSNRFHYNWHWWHAFGTGDMGNDGVHDIDYGRWGLGVDTHPSRISAMGGKYFHDDDQQFPDTQVVVFEWPGPVGHVKSLIYEMRLWSTTYPHDVDSGVEFHGTEGKMFLSKRGKVEVLGHRNRVRDDVKIEGRRGISVADHVRNWAACIREGGTPHAEIEVGHLSSALVHLGNIATRVGRTLSFDPETETITGDPEAKGLLRRGYREGHWAVPKGVEGTAAAVAPREGAAFVARAGRFDAFIDGRRIGRYVFNDPVCTRPYLSNVMTPSGRAATRAYPPQAGEKHDHGSLHPGIFMAFGDIGGADVWRLKGRVEQAGVIESPRAESAAADARLVVLNRYLDGDRVVCHERRTLTLHRRATGLVLVHDSTFYNDDAAFWFGDQEEMGLAVRVAPSMAVDAGGRMVDSEGRVNAKEIWGQPAAWCDYSGKVDGEHVGVMLVPDPQNFRPCWWHARDYGLLVANPFGRAAMKQGEPSRIEVNKGDRFRLRYAVVVHEGKTDLEAAFAEALSTMGA